MNTVESTLIALLRQQVTGQTQTIPSPVDWDGVARLAGVHGLCAMVYCGTEAMGLELPEGLQKWLYKEYQRAVFRDVQLRDLARSLSEALDAKRIPHILLRGICLKENYPMSALRTMSDIDILVHTDDFSAIRTVALDMGAVPGHSDGNHRNYTFPGGLTVEFHPELIHCDSPVGTGVNPGWQYAPEEKPGRMVMSEEGFYLNVIAHLANHFVSGGVGIRFVLDVWVCRHCRAPEMDRDFVLRELKRMSLYDFAMQIENLAECWFTTGVLPEEMEELSEYVISSGSHGTTQRAMLNAVTFSGGSAASALAGKAFYSRQEMENRYPWTRGKPWLMPAAWCCRAFRAVTKHGSLILSWGMGTARVSKTEVKKQKEKLERFGIINSTKSGE